MAPFSASCAGRREPAGLEDDAVGGTADRLEHQDVARPGRHLAGTKRYSPLFSVGFHPDLVGGLRDRQASLTPAMTTNASITACPHSMTHCCPHAPDGRRDAPLRSPQRTDRLHSGGVKPVPCHEAPPEGPSVGRRGIKEYRAPEALILIAADRDQKPLVCPSCGAAEVRAHTRSESSDDEPRAAGSPSTAMPAAAPPPTSPAPSAAPPSPKRPAPSA